MRGGSSTGGDVTTEVEYSEEEKENEIVDSDGEDFIVGDKVVFTDDATKSGEVTRVSDSSVWVKLGRFKTVMKRKHKVMKK